MDYLRTLLRLLWRLCLHPEEDARWQMLIDHVGHPTLYTILFLVIFCETGLVVTPFLPGDSLLFAVGAVGARGIGINIPLVTMLLILAAVLGDAANYWIGYRLGPRVFTSESSRLLNRKHLLRAQEFYEKYGAKTIILARFVPIVRTFAPFVAGIGRMNYFRFFLYNVIGGIGWVLICIGAGLLFGNIPFVRKRFEVIAIAIIVISVLPMVFEYLRARRAAKHRQTVILSEAKDLNSSNARDPSLRSG